MHSELLSLAGACPNALKRKLGKGIVYQKQSLDLNRQTTQRGSREWATPLLRAGQMVGCPNCTRKHAVLPQADGERLNYIRCDGEKIAIALEGRRFC